MHVTEGHVTSLDGVRLYYRMTGPGAPTVIVPNGLYYADDLTPLWQDRTAVVYDLRNRGRSEGVTDPDVLRQGVVNDVADLEAVRAHLCLERVALIGHSYVALVALRYAMTQPHRVGRVAMIGPPGYGVGHEAPPPPDAVALEVFQRLGALRQAPPSDDAVARCRAAWEILAALYVVDQSLAPAVAAWGRCDQANERAFAAYWTAHVEPSLRNLPVSASELAGVTCPTLVVHGTRDRSAPYASGRAWAARLASARLLAVPDVAHAPWLEAPTVVIPALQTFLGGVWPDAAEHVQA